MTAVVVFVQSAVLALWANIALVDVLEPQTLIAQSALVLAGVVRMSLVDVWERKIPSAHHAVPARVGHIRAVDVLDQLTPNAQTALPVPPINGYALRALL